MKKIVGFQKYDGKELAPNIMYTSDQPIDIDGEYDVEIYGKARSNGVELSGRYRGFGKLSLTLSKGASVVFWVLPRKIQTPAGFEPVPDVPDYLDEAERSMEHLFSRFLARRGFNIAEGEAQEAPSRDAAGMDASFGEDDDMDEWDGPELDTYNLVGEPDQPELVAMSSPQDMEIRGAASDGTTSGEGMDSPSHRHLSGTNAALSTEPPAAEVADPAQGISARLEDPQQNSSS